MFLQNENLTIRNAMPEDAPLLAKWWNDGKIMAHAGFPNGTGEKAADIAESLKGDTDDTQRRHIILRDAIPIGEMNYRNKGEKTAEMGIKICDFSLHDQGIGKKALSMLIGALFQKLGYEKIVLDTNVNNLRAQHVYERLGFQRLGVRENVWKSPTGELHSSVEYEMREKDFINFAQ